MRFIACFVLFITMTAAFGQGTAGPDAGKELLKKITAAQEKLDKTIETDRLARKSHVKLLGTALKDGEKKMAKYIKSIEEAKNNDPFIWAGLGVVLSFITLIVFLTSFLRQGGEIKKGQEVIQTTQKEVKKQRELLETQVSDISLTAQALTDQVTISKAATKIKLNMVQLGQLMEYFSIFCRGKKEILKAFCDKQGIKNPYQEGNEDETVKKIAVDFDLLEDIHTALCSLESLFIERRNLFENFTNPTKNSAPKNGVLYRELDFSDGTYNHRYLQLVKRIYTLRKQNNDFDLLLSTVNK